MMSIFAIAFMCWAVVSVTQALTGSRRRGGDQRLERRIEDLADAVARVQEDLDTIANKHDADYQMLEERLDFAERLLTRAKDVSG